MDANRRSVGLALAAAVLLLANIAALIGEQGTTDPGDGPDDVVASPDDGDATEGPDGPDGPDDDVSPSPSATPTPSPSASPDTDGNGGAGGGDGGSGGGDGRPAVALTAPADGTYRYGSSGSWSLRGAGQDTTVELPASASAVVTGQKGGGWQVRLTAGPRVVDDLRFELAGDGGYAWTGWAVGRSGAGSAVLTCRSDGAWYRAGAAARPVEHSCTTTDGTTASGTVTPHGSERVTLGDGGTVVADHLVQTATVAGAGVAGDARLELWLDPATGLRVREERVIEVTTTVDGAVRSYREEVVLTLVSMDPA